MQNPKFYVLLPQIRVKGLPENDFELLQDYYDGLLFKFYEHCRRCNIMQTSDFFQETEQRFHDISDFLYFFYTKEKDKQNLSEVINTAEKYLERCTDFLRSENELTKYSKTPKYRIRGQKDERKTA